MPNVLVVAYFFPPVGGVGIQRTLKHVTYLPVSGWQPTVVAPANPGYRIIDPAGEALVPPGVRVHRAAGIEPAHLRRAIGALIPGRRDRVADAGTSGAVTGAPLGPASRLRSAANAAWSVAIPLVFFPDDAVLWVAGAVRAGVRAAERSRVDAIYSSSPPISDHLAAGLLARRLGRPWIADFRDPWIGNAYARPLPPFHRELQRRIERRIVERASRVTVATGGMRRMYAERYPHRADRFVHVPNGYDPADLAPSQEIAARGDADERFRLVHAGSVYGDEALRLFLDGLERLLERDPGVRSRLAVEFVGWFSEESQATARRRLPGLDPVVRQTGLVPRERAIAIERASDAGLLVLAGSGDRSVFGTTKLYEYLGLDLPVLAVAPSGEVREILEALDWGVVADPTVDGVANGVARIMAAPRPDRRADPDGLYDRRTQARRLAAELEAVIGSGAKSQRSRAARARPRRAPLPPASARG